MLVVVPDVDAQNALEIAAASDQDPVETVPADGSDPALGVGVRVRRSNRRADHLDPLGTEDLIEPAAELRIAIVDQKPERLLIAELHHQVASLLRCPAAVGGRATGDVLDPSRRQRNEEQHVDPLQERGLNGEEVAGQRSRRLLAHERSPRQPRPLRCWREAGLDQHPAHRRRRHHDTRALELTDDPPVPPELILPRETKDQSSHRRLERRPSRPHVRIGPATGNQLAMPTQQRVRPHQEARPSRARQRAAQRRQERPISPRQPWPSRLPPQNSQLVAQHKNLQFLRAARPPQQPYQREQVPHDEIHKRPEQSSPPSTTTRAPNLPSSTPRRAADKFANPTRRCQAGTAAAKRSQASCAAGRSPT
jgi:hypothetical protein